MKLPTARARRSAPVRRRPARKRRRRRKPELSDELIVAAALVVLAFSGGVTYLVWPTALLWWLAPLTAVPLVLYVMSRGERRNQRAKDADHFKSDDTTPWWNP